MGISGAAAFAMCGVKAPPRPPLGTEDQYGQRPAEGDAGPGCDHLEAPAAVPVGQTTEAICASCQELRERRERCGVNEPLGGRCKALCQRYDGKRDLDPRQDVDGRAQLMKEWNRGHVDGGAAPEGEAPR